jgi:hypothetical protein
MAKRPVFVPTEAGDRLVDQVDIEFTWHSGMAPSQKRKNVVALHQAAAKNGLVHLLEISSKSEWEVGQKLSAFYVKVPLSDNDEVTTLESAYQGSKVFEQGGPFTDLFSKDSRDAKRDPRLRNSGRLQCFRFQGIDYPLSPATAFYDWLYLKSLFRYREWLVRRLEEFQGFTDIEFNPERSLNCQARSCATFIALQKRNSLNSSVESFEFFRELIQATSI